MPSISPKSTRNVPLVTKGQTHGDGLPGYESCVQVLGQITTTSFNLGPGVTGDIPIGFVHDIPRDPIPQCIII